MSKFTKIAFKVLDLLVIFALTFGSPMSALADPSPTGATIVTDLPDYPPGALVLMTGTGWAPDEGVHVVVSADDGSWTLESNPDPVADGAGGFTYEFQLPDWFVATYTVTATGFTSGTATVTFTDLSIGSYDQCSNDDGDGYTGSNTGCHWIFGNLQSNNSTYAEGDATVQRLWLEDLVAGSSHTVTLKYGTTKGGHHAYDYLTTWNYSENWITDADLCEDIDINGNAPGGSCTLWGADDLLPIPVDPNPAFVTDAVPQPAGRNFTMRNGDMTLATTPAIVSGSYAGDSETVITIAFTVGNDPDACVTDNKGVTTCSVVLWFGAHVALTSEWESGGGAGQVEGSPYHVALDAVDGAAVGQRDNQMQAGAVIPNGTIIIVKDAVPNDAQDFNFNLTNGTTVNLNFSLDDDADGTLPNTTSPNYSVPPGAYTAQELNIPTGWTLTNLVCTDPTGNTTVSIPTATATINLASAETVTCTYTDTFAKATPTVTTQVHDPSHTDVTNGTVAIGTSVHDSATVSTVAPFPAPTGTVTYKFFTNNACSGDPISTQTVAVGQESSSTGGLAAGSYGFLASYSGDANYNPATGICEPFSVGQGTSSIATTLHKTDESAVAVNGSVPLGTIMHDLATVTVSGSFAPTGSVSFTFYANNSCEGEGIPAGSVVLDGASPGVAHPSSSFGPLQTGSYSFKASWGGDANYTGATSDCEPFSVGKGTSTVGTTLHKADESVVTVGSSVPLGTTMHDLATVTVSGSFAPSGNVSFTFYANNSCSGDGTAAGSVALDGANPGVAHPSNTFGPLPSGTYSFQATWAGDANYSGDTSDCEPFTVDQGTATVTTTLHDADENVVAVGSSVPLGTIMHDLATITVSGSFAPAGVISFTFFTDASCDGAGIHAGNVVPDGSNPGVAHPSSSFGPLPTGSYSFKAFWTGDDNYPGTASTCEPFTVNQGTSTVTTTLHDADENVVAIGSSVALGTIMHDLATVTASGSFAPTGSVNFKFFNNATCDGPGTAAGTVAIVGGVAHPSDSTAGLAAGSYSFQATWSGDGNYSGATSDCEPFTVDKANSSTSTDIHNDATHAVITSIGLGGTVHDLATVADTNPSFNPTGNVSFTWFTNGACTGDGTVAGTVALDGSGIAHPSSSFGPLAAGSYSFQATYAGDNNFNGSTGACEPLTVGQGTSSVVTTLHDADHNVVAIGSSVALGTIMHDLATVTVSGSFAPTGNVSFTFYTNGACDGPGKPAGTVALDGSSPGVAHPSGGTAALAAGSYSFQATWSGDGNYSGATSDCEPFTVDKGTITLTTTIHNAADDSVIALNSHVALGTSVYDTVAFSGQTNGFAINPPDAYFKFYTNDTCSSDTIPAGSGTQSEVKGPLGAGSYSFRAFYAGNTNYNSAISDCEPFTVDKAQLSITTTIHDGSHNVIPNNSSVPLGTSAHDNATVSGAVAGFPIPAISFTFNAAPIANGATDAGFHATTVSTAPLGAGNYVFVATVGTNANYIGATSADEPFTVSKAQLSISTTVHDAAHNDITNGSVPLGSSAHDNATVGGGVAGFPIPAISFFFNGNPIANGSTEAGFDATSISTGPLGAGSYVFYASVASDSNYFGGTSADEPFTVSKANTTTTTQVHNAAHDDITNTAVGSGTAVHDNASVTSSNNSFPITGTVTYNFYNNATCTGTPSSTETVAVGSESTAQTLFNPGSYCYKAIYSGDDNYNGSTGAPEPFTILPESRFTDTEFCPLPAEGFRLLFHQDPQASGNSIYKLNATNPGQFYYNVFYAGTPGANVTLEIEVPYPFITQGAVPIQMHDSVTFYNTNCYVPSPSLPGYTVTTEALSPVSSSGNQIIGFEDYIPTKAIGESTTVTVTGTVPSTGLLYVTIHLDYGFKGTSGWTKVDAPLPDADTDFDDAQNATLPTSIANGTVTILNPQTYEASFSGSDTGGGSADDAQTFQSINVFKKNPGVGGSTLQTSTGSPKKNIKVQIYQGTKLMGTVYTDEDGWYMWQFKYTGKATTFTVKLPDYGLSKSVTMKSNGFVVVDFTTLP